MKNELNGSFNIESRARRAVARWNNDDDLWLLRFIYEQVALIAPTLASRKVIKLRLLLNDFLPRDA